MNATSAQVPRAVDEFELAGLTPAPSQMVKPPRVKESPVHLECTHLKTVELPSNDPQRPNLVVFGRVLGIHIDDSILRDGMIDMDVFKPIARLGYMDYTRSGQRLQHAAPLVNESPGAFLNTDAVPAKRIRPARCSSPSPGP